MKKKFKPRKTKHKPTVAKVEIAKLQEPTEEKKESTLKKLAKKYISPIVRLVGHTASAGTAYGCFCAAELLMAKVLHYLFTFGTPHQLMLFETGETLVFYVGFAHWAITFLIGAVRLIIAEFHHSDD